MAEQDKIHTSRSSSIFVCSSGVYVRLGIMVLREGERRILVVGLGVVSEGEALLSTLLKNLDMVVSVECIPCNWLWLEFKNTREL
jgi:hypothetical protein